MAGPYKRFEMPLHFYSLGFCGDVERVFHGVRRFDFAGGAYHNLQLDFAIESGWDFRTNEALWAQLMLEKFRLLHRNRFAGLLLLPRSSRAEKN
jgi:hypothetical protein